MKHDNVGRQRFGRVLLDATTTFHAPLVAQRSVDRDAEFAMSDANGTLQRAVRNERPRRTITSDHAAHRLPIVTLAPA